MGKGQWGVSTAELIANSTKIELLQSRTRIYVKSPLEYKHSAIMLETGQVPFYVVYMGKVSSVANLKLDETVL